MTPEYAAELEAMRAAEKTYAEVLAQYRAMKIGDDEFLAARKVRDAAAARFDVAFAAEAARPCSL